MYIDYMYFSLIGPDSFSHLTAPENYQLGLSPTAYHYHYHHHHHHYLHTLPTYTTYLHTLHTYIHYIPTYTTYHTTLLLTT